jgi:hypothetical protein
MWVVFYDPNTAFNHPDKYIVAIVSDDDIFAYQNAMPGEKHEISADNPYLQPFVTQQRTRQILQRKSNGPSTHRRSYSRKRSDC